MTPSKATAILLVCFSIESVQFLLRLKVKVNVCSLNMGFSYLLRSIYGVLGTAEVAEGRSKMETVTSAFLRLAIC